MGYDDRTEMCPSKAAVELAAAEEQKDISSKLSPMVDKIGMVIFVVTMIGLISPHSSTANTSIFASIVPCCNPAPPVTCHNS